LASGLTLALFDDSGSHAEEDLVPVFPAVRKFIFRVVKNAAIGMVQPRVGSILSRGLYE
jgi:hypothetical protein